MAHQSPEWLRAAATSQAIAQVSPTIIPNTIRRRAFCLRCSSADSAAPSIDTDSVDTEHASQDEAHADHDAEDRRNPDAGHRCPAVL